MLGEALRGALRQSSAPDGFRAFLAHHRPASGTDGSPGGDIGGPAPVLAGFAGAAREARGWRIEVILAPEPGATGLRDHDGSLPASLVSASLDHVCTSGGGDVSLWTCGVRLEVDAPAAAAGLEPTRELVCMTRSLTGGLPRTSLPVRPFRPGEDEAAWIEVNNRAFSAHPDQGNWDLPVLTEREQEPWFDPQGFLLHERDGVLAGSCWTKVHPGDPLGISPEAVGEIYVISVDPGLQGQGLGRSLVLRGLQYLAARSIRQAILYTDAGNAPALALYRSLGFEMHHVERCHAGRLPAGAPPEG